MKAFAPYRVQLESLLAGALRAPKPPQKGSLAAVLDGQPASELRRLVSIDELRRVGAFFTGSRLSRRLAARLRGSLKPDSVILDPACGAGDLLIACAALLPVNRDIEEAMERWSRQLLGRDVHREFVLTTRTRLALAAVRAGAKTSEPLGRSLATRLTGIQVGSGLTDREVIAAATHVIMNPPFSRVRAPDACDWAGGTINAASLFLEACVKGGQPGTRIVALLPDVLRSGARYEKWRSMVASHAHVLGVQLLGQFDRWTDVDVFLLDLELPRGKTIGSSKGWMTPAGKSSRIGDHFTIRVGPVVDYREPKRGGWHPFIRARDVPAWATLRKLRKSRRFAGRVVQPPFVVVRRTSRYGDKARAAATIVASSNPVAVENHLLILVPKDGTIARCVRALRVLKRPETSSWLNRRIRCRHLTLQAIADVPWIDP